MGLAEALQRGMHQLARPWARRPAISVFRDSTSLSANNDLWWSIQQELERSRFFIYLASPEAAASRWVQREIAYWLDNRPMHHFLIAVSSGTVSWDEDAGDFDWARTSALPRMLEGAFPAEPLWVDFAEIREHEKYSLRQADFRNAVATLVAPLRGCTKDELDSEDIRQHRIVTRLRRGAVTGLATLLVTSLAAGGFAWQQRGEALDRARVSASQALAARSLEMADIDPRKAAQFALYADQVQPTGESAQALARAVDVNGDVVRHLQGGNQAVVDYRGAGHAPTTNVVISRDGGTLAYYSELGSRRNTPSGRKVHIFDLRTGEERKALPTHGWAQTSKVLQLSSDGRILMLQAPDNRIEVWDVRRAKLLRTLTASAGEDLPEVGKGLRSWALSPDGRWAAATYFEPRNDALQLAVWNVRSGRAVSRGEAAGDDPQLAFAGDSSRLSAVDVATGTSWTYLLDAGRWREGRRLPEVPDDEGAVRFPDGGGDRALLRASGNKAQVWNVRTGEKTDAGPAEWMGSPALAQDAPDRIAAGDGKHVAVYDVHTHRKRVLGSFSWPVVDVAVSGDGRWVAAGSSDGAVSLFDASRTHLGVRLENEDGVKPDELAPDGRMAHRTLPGGKGTEVWAATGGSAYLKRLGRIPRTVDASEGAIAVSGDGRRVALQYQGQLSLWDPRSGKQVGRGAAFGYRLGLFRGQSLNFLSDDVHVVTAWDKGVLVIDTRTWEISQVLLRGQADFVQLALSGDRRTLASIDRATQEIHVWRSSAGGAFEEVRSVKALPSADPLSISVSHEGEKVAVVDGDGRIFVLDVSSGRIASSTEVTSATGGAVFSRDAQTLATWGDGLELWNTDTGEAQGGWTTGPGTRTGGSAARTAAPGTWTGPPESEAQASGSEARIAPARDRGLITLEPDGSLTRRTMERADWRAALCHVVDEPLAKGDYDRYLSDLEVGRPC